MARVTLENVHKIYPGGRAAVKGVSLEVGDGEFLVLVGPSGCGKSTILRMIAGLEAVTEGVLRIGERVVNDVAPKDRNIAMVFQSYALYPHMSVYDNVAFGLRLRGVKREELDRRVRSAATVLGIETLLDRRPAQLSGGQRQRVALGRALVREPAVFLLDEPLSNLDARMRLQMRIEIGRLHRKLGTTMIYVTHDQLEAMTLGDRIVVMNDGAVQQVGTPQEVYARPANRFVAGFIGSPAMNLVAGRFDPDGRFVSAQGSLTLALPAHAPLRADLAGNGPTHVWLSVRAEDVAFSLQGEDYAPVGGDGSVDAVEVAGHEALVHVRVGGDVLVARTTPGCAPPAGSRLQLAFRVGGIHAFDATSGNRLKAE